MQFYHPGGDPEMYQYADKVIRGTPREDSLVILQFLRGMIGRKFSFLNYYKEIPVSYDATLLSVENEMAEFELHEYQAKVISLERKTLVRSHKESPFREDLMGEAFYINAQKKRVVLCKFEYARIRSEMRRFVRVQLDRPIESDIYADTRNNDCAVANVRDISLGGALVTLLSDVKLVPGMEIDIVLKLPNLANGTVTAVSVRSTVIKVLNDGGAGSCILEFNPEKLSQQLISYYINQRQVEIIKELKELIV